MPRQHAIACARTTLSSLYRISLAPLFRLLTLPLLLALAPPAPAHAAPRLWLPTPPGETWKVIQGYGCGTHNGWDRYSLDLANSDGRTYGAPVRAAADGRIWAWTSKSGTLILEHGGGFYTMYTHMASVVTTARDLFVARGTVIGAVGDRGAHGTPHLHFTAFTGQGVAASGRKSVPLSFAEGYDLPELGGCNQHGGQKLTAGGQADALDRASVSGVIFNGGEPGRWYNGDLRIDFSGPLTGFSQAWDHDPGGDAPQFKQAGAGFVQLTWAGEGLHTLYVRAWGDDGNQALSTYGPVGYDTTPPRPPAPIAPVEAHANASLKIQWGAAGDDGSGVAGYRVYIGAQADGTSDWFTPAPQVESPPLAPGRYLLRVQPLDYAGNAGVWATIGQLVSRDK
ncbi:MAG: peptidoglycan DD-metalloendopeptidase family protein [Roseiflexaceae bacterium]